MRSSAARDFICRRSPTGRPQDWKKKGEEVSEIVDRRLGWDITDFGRGKFCKCGLAIFTLRNGNPVADLPSGKGKLYAEKILMFKHDQVCPFHFHWHKMEDIINRGGGELWSRSTIRIPRKASPRRR